MLSGDHRRRVSQRAKACCLCFAALFAITAIQAAPAPLVLESKISLGPVQGRIDHLAIDIDRQRLYVAELGNNTVGVVDLTNHTVLRTLSGFHEPQGIGYEPSTDTVYVANAGNGAMQLLQGADFKPIGVIALGEDADNVRVDSRAHRVMVGYGRGALAVIDAASHQVIATIRLKAHPESFQIDPDGRTAFVNIPDAQEIAVIDLTRARQSESWKPVGLHANFPLALDASRHQVIAVFRYPPTVGIFNTPGGQLSGSIGTCADADDAFIDPKRNRLYVSCGEGFIDVLSLHAQQIMSLAQLPTLPGTRTALFVPALDRFYLAVRANGGDPAAIWVFRPDP
jgi:DNA-binding beta-propeller fold protein YncE